MVDEQGPWIDTNPGPRNAERRQRDSLFCRPCKSLRVFVGSHIFINASKPVKVCHILWNFVKCIGQMSLFTRANLTEFAQLCHRYLLMRHSHMLQFTPAYFFFDEPNLAKKLLVNLRKHALNFMLSWGQAVYP